jgi:hypothetical protein
MNPFAWLLRRSMPETLSGPARAAARELENLGLWHGPTLWESLAPGWTLDATLGSVNRARASRGLPPLTRADVAEAVAAAAAQDAEGALPVRMWRRALLPALAIAVGWLAWSRSAPQQVIVVTHPLPAYHILTAADVAAATAVFTADAPSDPGTVVGRFATRALAKGEVLRAADLVGPGRLPGLATRRILTVAVGAVDAKRAGTLPAIVTIEPAAKAAADVGVQPKPIPDAYLLALTADGKTATLALTDEQLAALRPALSRFDLLLVWAPD